MVPHNTHLDMSTPAFCPHCESPVIAVRRDTPRCEGFRGWEIRAPLRWYETEKHAFLHHFNCGMEPLADPDVNWLACRSQDSIDIYALFDPRCSDCEQRWVSEGGPLWNSTDPQVLERISHYQSMGISTPRGRGKLIT